MIGFSWNGSDGYMKITIKHLIYDMTLKDFRKWLKLFFDYGTTEQHLSFLDDLNLAMTDMAQEIGMREQVISDLQRSMSPETQKAAKQEEKDLTGLKRRFRSVQKKKDLLRGYLA